MDEVYSYYVKKYRKISEWKLTAVTWNFSNKNLILYEQNTPFGVFEFKIIGEVKKENIVWAWENKDNFIDKEFYPKGLKRKIKNIIGNTNNLFLSTIIALHALNGIWYIHLHDESMLIEKIAILTKIIKIYK
jgi:hypothetical protein